MLAIGHDVRPAVGQARYGLKYPVPPWSSTFSGENVAMVLAPTTFGMVRSKIRYCTRGG
jgi:hypothetical protein